MDFDKIGPKLADEGSKPRSYSDLFTKSSTSLSSQDARTDSCFNCSPSSCSSSSCSSYDGCCSFICCDPYKPPVSQVQHIKEFVCKEGTFSETFKSPFALKSVSVPGWLAYDGMILCFYSYYQEPIAESPIENYRIHQCQIRFYLEDNTIEVIEPTTFDPGFTQGRVINRGKINLPPPAEHAYFTLDHFNVGCEVTLYGKTFYIHGCNSFTRNFLNRLGIPVPADSEPPIDKATEKRKELNTCQFARKSGFNPELNKVAKFLSQNKKVLRFWAYWDDRCSEYGDLRKFVLHYFLEDDTIEIKELLDTNSGFEPHPAFLYRSKVPKDLNKPYPLPGVKEEALRILKVLGNDECGGFNYSYITDRLCPGIEEELCIKDSDLAIGAALNIFGRCFILTDCDEFTKRYYRDKYGVQDFTPLVLNEANDDPPPRKPPPHNGWGSEEDTLANWNRTEVSPPKKDELKFLTCEKDVLTFKAQFYQALHKVNTERKFTIKYFLVDRTIQILEKGHPNSGLKKGLFLARTKLKKQLRGEEFGHQSEYYFPDDFFVGRIIELNGFKFQLTNADELTLIYMELHKDMFPHADICKILNKVREIFGPIPTSDILRIFSHKDTKKLGIQICKDFRTALMELSKCSLSEHEIITLHRAYKVEPPSPGVDFETLRIVMQTQLRRFNFDKILLERIEYSLRHYDPCRTGLVDREPLRSVLRGAKLPVAKDLINFLVDRYPAGDNCNRLNYNEIMKFLDWEGNPVVCAKPASLHCVMKWLEPKPPKHINCINYRAFLYDVCPNIKCSLPEICCPPDCRDVNEEHCGVSGNPDHQHDDNFANSNLNQTNGSDNWDDFFDA